MELTRKNLANCAIMFGIKPGHMGKNKLRRAIIRTMRKYKEMAEHEHRMAMKEAFREWIEQRLSIATTHGIP